MHSTTLIIPRKILPVIDLQTKPKTFPYFHQNLAILEFKGPQKKKKKRQIVNLTSFRKLGYEMLGLPDLTITEINSSLIFETAEKNAGLGKYSGALGLGKPNNSASNFI